MKQVLLNAGLVQTHAYWGNGDFIQAHFDGGLRNPIIWDKKNTGTVIIPLRDKDAVRDSWRRRSENLQSLEWCWAEMLDFIAKKDDVHTVHIDDPTRRVDEMAAITERLNTYLVADFSERVGHNH